MYFEALKIGLKSGNRKKNCRKLKFEYNLLYNERTVRFFHLRNTLYIAYIYYNNIKSLDIPTTIYCISLNFRSTN